MDRALTGHTGSVEDLQWSPTEASGEEAPSANTPHPGIQTHRQTGRGPARADRQADGLLLLLAFHPSVFISCSSDRSLRVWDTRSPKREAMLALANAHDGDVNVCSWNR